MTSCPSEAQLNAVRQGQHLTPDEIAAVLDRLRPQVLREMGRQHLWRGTDVSVREDQFQDVVAVLWMRRFTSENHVLRALWAGLGFRAKDFWKAARRREVPVGEFFDGAVRDDRSE